MRAKRQRLHKDPDKATGVPAMSGKWRTQLLTRLCAVSHTGAGLLEEAPSAALLVTCPRVGWRVRSGQTCQGKRRNREIKISGRTKVSLVLVGVRHSPTFYSWRGLSEPLGDTWRLNPLVDGAAFCAFLGQRKLTPSRGSSFPFPSLLASICVRQGKKGLLDKSL